MHRRVIWSVAIALPVFVTIAGSGCQDDAASSTRDMTFSAQAIPPDTKSLVQALSVVRNAEGAVTVSGKLLLPKGTKLWIQPLSRDGNRPLAQIEALVQPGGSFSTPRSSMTTGAHRDRDHKSLRYFRSFVRTRGSPPMS